MKKNRSAKLKITAKSTSVEPVAQKGQTPPLTPSVPKRGPGRPRKVDVFAKPVLQLASSLNNAKTAAKLLEPGDPKALTTFRKAIADAEKLLMAPADYDGGGTAENGPVVTKEALQKRVTRRLNVLDRFLTDDKLLELLAFSSLKEVGIYEGILLDKSQVLSGQPNVIIGNEDRQRIDEVLPKLMQELRRRGLITTVSERKVEFSSPS